MELGLFLALAGAAMSVSIAGIGSILGVAMVGQGAAGVCTEKPELFGKVLLLEVLPGTQGIYGFIGTFFVLNQLGLLGDAPKTISVMQGWQFFIACLPVAIGGLISAIFQGKVSTAGLNLVAKNPDKSGNAIILSAMVETYAVLGLLATILLIMGIKVA
ncbi:MAG: V-type ATP synthase subunit K [bacterium]